jgi:hypothetical protein
MEVGTFTARPPNPPWMQRRLARMTAGKPKYGLIVARDFKGDHKTLCFTLGDRDQFHDL